MFPNQKKPKLKAEELLQILQQQQEIIDGLMSRDQQGRRILWELVMAQGGSAIIPGTPTPALWFIKFAKLEDGRIAIAATTLDEPKPEKLAALADVLRGTELDLAECMAKNGLAEYPTAAIERALAENLVVWSVADRVWLDVTVARTMTQINKQTDASQN